MGVGHLVELPSPRSTTSAGRSGAWPTCRSSRPRLQAEGARRRSRRSSSRRSRSCSSATTSSDRQRLRRRARGRADLRLHLRDAAARRQAGRAALDLVDDEAGDPRGLRAAAPRRGDRAARGRRALALRGRLARRHERDPRRDDPRPRVGRRRRLARPGPDADARDDRQARARDPGVRPRAVLARPRDLRRRATRASGSRATRFGSRTASAPTRSSRRSRARTGIVESVERKEQSERAPLLYDLTSLQRDANRRFGFSARRTLQAAQSLYEGKKAITYPRTVALPLRRPGPELKPTAATLSRSRSTPRRRATCSASTSCRSARGQRREGRRPPRDHPDRGRARPSTRSRPTSADLRPRRAPLPGRLPPRRRATSARRS